MRGLDLRRICLEIVYFKRNTKVKISIACDRAASLVPTLTTYYGVVSHGARHASPGLFEGAGFPEWGFRWSGLGLGCSLNLQGEYDGQEWNAGGIPRAFSPFTLYCARLFPDDWAYGTTLTWKLRDSTATLRFVISDKNHGKLLDRQIPK